MWNERSADRFKESGWGREDSCKAWNARYAGKPALSTKNSNGYLHGNISNRSFQAHRVIWKLIHGVDPVEIDHINGNRTDNRLVNLRHVDAATNRKNCQRSKKNTSGVTGVTLHRPTGKWHARILANYTYVDLGYFDDIELARQARKSAEMRHGFHENHGRAA
jgi:hypothetical protein